MTISLGDLYIIDKDEIQEDLYRMGNSSSLGFTIERCQIDCDIKISEGTKIVIANGKGLSAFDSVTPYMKRKKKNIWKIKKGMNLYGIRVSRDLRKGKEGHYMIAPEKDMPMLKYMGILQELSLDKSKCVKLTPMEIENA